MRRFVHEIRVRYNECDQQNAVFNANYLVYFDVVMTELWRQAFGAYGAMEAYGIDLVVAEANIKYLKPARFDDLLAIEAILDRLGTTSIVTTFTVRRDDDVICEGQLRHVVVDLEGTKTPMPDDVRSALEPYGS